jgi:hypothetical protein
VSRAKQYQLLASHLASDVRWRSLSSALKTWVEAWVADMAREINRLSPSSFKAKKQVCMPMGRAFISK